jgi:hypothetical protein
MSSVTVNGKTYVVRDGGNLSITNNEIYVDGKLLIGSDSVKEKVPSVVNIVVKGNLLNLTSDSSVTVEGDVLGSISAGGSVRCKNIEGNVITHGSLRCGDIVGDVQASGSIRRY